MEYQLMEARHADQVAEIHSEGQPGTLLTKLGKPFLSTLYEGICGSEWGFGVVAVDDKLVAGVGVLTTSTQCLFREIKRRRGLRLLLFIIPRLLVHPDILLDVYQSWRYPAKMGLSKRSPASDTGSTGQPSGKMAPEHGRKDAEFLFLGVRKTYQGRKIASGIFDQSVDICRERRIDHLVAVVEHSNWRLHQVASHHVARYGWRCIRQTELNGRVMDVIEMDLTRELLPEEWGPGTLDPEVLPEPWT